MHSRLLTKASARSGRFLLMLLVVSVVVLGLTLTILTTAIAAGQIAPVQAAAETATAEPATAKLAELSLEPAAASVTVSDTLTVDIVVSDVVDLYGAELTLVFDPSVVTVVDDNPSRAGVQIGTGSCPQADFVAHNSADNGSGAINYVVTSLAPAAPCTGMGIVASITFLGLAPGTSAISFTTWLLSDSSIQSITTTVSNGSVMVEPRLGIVQGAVTLQGRTDNSGISVEVWDSDGWPSSPLTSTVTGVAGSYALTVPAGNYTVTMEIDGYLDALRTNVAVDADWVVDLPGLELPCGDSNDDDLVNVLDLTIVGAHYRLACGNPGWDGRADMIDDCVINVLDLTCSGVNYGRTAPVNWP